MDTLTTSQVAAKLNTDAKVLRRFLRATPEWSNPGSGGRYAFTSTDLAQLRKQFPKWVAGEGAKTTRKPKARVVATPTGAEVRPTTDRRRRAKATEALPPVDIEDSPEVWDGPLPDARAARIEGEERARRLDERLRATGMHLSQWTPERWAKAGVA